MQPQAGGKKGKIDGVDVDDHAFGDETRPKIKEGRAGDQNRQDPAFLQPFGDGGVSAQNAALLKVRRAVKRPMTVCGSANRLNLAAVSRIFGLGGGLGGRGPGGLVFMAAFVGLAVQRQE